MMTARRIATTLLLLPLAEVVVFVAVALAVIMAIFTLFQFRFLGQRVDY